VKPQKSKFFSSKQQTPNGFDALFGNFSATRTSRTRAAAWEELTILVCAVGPPKTVMQVKVRATTMRSDVKKHAAALKDDQKRTGGGPPTVPPLKEWELRFVATVRKYKSCANKEMSS
jgi:hypothetical protein